MYWDASRGDGRDRGGTEQRVLLEKALKKARAAETEQIDEHEFIEHYPSAVVEEDLRYVETMQGRFAAERTPEIAEAEQWAEVLEVLLNEQVEQNAWLGPNATTRKASRFDDVANGVDVLVQVEQETSVSHLALAVDVTYGHFLSRKLERIRDEIRRGKLTTVKYFSSPDDTFKGALSLVPRVVVGASKEKLMALAKLWTDGKNKELAIDPIQLELLDEIAIQLETYMNYAKSLGNGKLVDIFRRQLAIINSIRQLPDKQALYDRPGATDYLTDDNVFQAISDGMKLFETEKV